MRVHLIGFLAAFVLISCDPTGQLTKNVHANENSPSLSSFLSPFRSALKDFRNLLGGNYQYSTVGGFGDSLQERTFRMFMKLYNKTYSTQSELRRRMSIFLERRKEIEQSVREFDEGRTTFKMRENPFIDLDDAELKTLTGVSAPKTDELLPEERRAIIAERKRQRRSVDLNENEVDLLDSERYDLEDLDEYDDIDDDSDEFDDADDPGLTVMAPENLPASMDWRQTGCIATPMHQRQCGCCYAIATMNTIEAMRCLSRKSSVLLSPQHIVDCATAQAGYKNYGCDGGWPTQVFQYLQNTGVAVRETCYPFVRSQGFCKLRQKRQSSGCTVNASPTDARLTYKVLNNENDILHHVARTGPVITVMKASQRFLFYSSGIFDDPSCSRARRDVDHAIVIVGYGKENGIDYWLIKNSWGTREWGEMGYGKYRRGRNVCSIGHWGWVILS